MKKLNFYFLTILLLSFLVNCTTTNYIVEKQDFDQKLVPEIDSTHVVVRYPSKWTDADKEVFLDTMPIKNEDQFIEKCNCGDPSLVQLTWDYDKFSSGDIQTAKNNLKGGPAGPQGDWPFTFNLPLLEDEGSYQVTDSKLLTGEEQAVLATLNQSLLDTDLNGEEIVIVVIDTGIDYYKNRDQEPFLYKTENLVPGCLKQDSGWNFIYNTKSVSDDHGHGTYVTRLITSELQKQGVGYQILPIKAFNSKGEGKYWDIVCALSYVKELQRLNEQTIGQKRQFMVNASFGFGFFKSKISEEPLDNYKSIAEELIDSLNQSVTFIASAGNINNNVDEIGKENFPASFTSNNIIGVGGYVTNAEGKQVDGNYGVISIDVAAPYTDYKFDFIKEKVTLTGSSYSAAYTSAKIAELIKSLQSNSVGKEIIPPAEIKANFYNTNNGWIQTDKGLSNDISKGRFLEY